MMWEVAGGILIAACVWPSIVFIFDLNGTRAANRRFMEDLDRANRSGWEDELKAEMDQLLRRPAKQGNGEQVR